MSVAHVYEMINAITQEAYTIETSCRLHQDQRTFTGNPTYLQLKDTAVYNIKKQFEINGLEWVSEIREGERNNNHGVLGRLK